MNLIPSTWKAPGLLVLLCVLLFVPGISTLPPIDRDEARFAQASHQMIETGDYVRIHFQDEPRHKKPIGIYWLQVLAAKSLGSTESKEIRPFRLPSLLGALLAVLGTYATGRRLFEEREALLGAALLACTLLVVVEAHQATTDAMLLACVAASQWALADLYAGRDTPSRSRSKAFLMFWTAQGVGILLKGPIVPLVAAFTLVSLSFWDRSWSWLKGLRPLAGSLLTMLLVLPWTLAIWSATDGAFFQDAIRGDLLPKLLSGQESHGAPPGYYLLLLPLAFWPASCLLGLTFRQAWKERASTGVRFCICWVLPAWLLFEAVPTKLPHYVLPLYPALALLSARTVLQLNDTPAPWSRFWPPAVALVLLGLFGVLIIACALVVPWVVVGRPDPLGILTAVAGLAVTFHAIRLTGRNRFLPAMKLCIVGSLLIYGLLLHHVLPSITPLWMSRILQERITELAHEGIGKETPVVSAGYHEPSLVFLLGTDTRLVSAPDAARALADSPGTVSIVWEREAPKFFEKADELGVKLHSLGTVEGFNYSKGRKMKLLLFTSATRTSGAKE